MDFKNFAYAPSLMKSCHRESMFTERIPCQNDSAVAQRHEENSHRERGADQGGTLSTYRSLGFKGEELLSYEKGNTGSCDQVSSQRKSTRLSQGGRVLRNHRYRRMFDENRHTKRLFTPEIKKYLKDWLIRRRDHPYPNRDEKKSLAIQTGLTYIQICNWFANWRRKLKNAGSEDQRTWSHLIKSYNTHAEGNVEHFSICSDDSIWDGKELADSGDLEDDYSDEAEMLPAGMTVPAAMDHCYSIIYHGIKSLVCSNGEIFNSNTFLAPITATQAAAQCYTVSSTTTEDEGSRVIYNSRANRHRKIKEMETRAQRRAASKRKMENRGKIDKLTPREKETSKILSAMKRKHSGPKAAGAGPKVEPKIPEEPKIQEPPSQKVEDEGPSSSQSQTGKKKAPDNSGNGNTLLRKWMYSAENFQPSYSAWNTRSKMTLMPRPAVAVKQPGQLPSSTTAAIAATAAPTQIRTQDELDAAEALTQLGDSR